MNIKYYFMGLMMASVALTGFTSCSDDNGDAPSAADTKEDLTFAAGQFRVKIRPENSQALPIVSGTGDYKAYSLSPDVAEVKSGDDGNLYVEGYKNGVAQIIVSDASDSLTRLPVTVYTTDDRMTLSHDSYSFKIPKGFSSTSADCHVVLGNGGYTTECDKSSISVSIDPESGVITMQAASGNAEYDAVVTVTDISGLSAQINVTVEPTLDFAFSADDEEELLGMTVSAIDYCGSHSWFFDNYSTDWSSKTVDGITSTGYNLLRNYNHCHRVNYPEGLPLV